MQFCDVTFGAQIANDCSHTCRHKLKITESLRGVTTGHAYIQGQRRSPPPTHTNTHAQPHTHTHTRTHTHTLRCLIEKPFGKKSPISVDGQACCRMSVFLSRMHLCPPRKSPEYHHSASPLLTSESPRPPGTLLDEALRVFVLRPASFDQRYMFGAQ